MRTDGHSGEIPCGKQMVIYKLDKEIPGSVEMQRTHIAAENLFIRTWGFYLQCGAT